MSFVTYNAQTQAVDGINDVQIAPDKGSFDPFLRGADRTVAKRSFTVHVLPTAMPKTGRAQNTMYTTSADGSKTSGNVVVLIIRIYAPDRGLDIKGGVPLPAVGLVTSTGQQLAIPDCPLDIVPDTGINQVIANAGSPTPLPRLGAFGRDPLTWRKYVNAPTAVADGLTDNAVLGALNGPVAGATAKALPSGGFFENIDNKYVYTFMDRSYGQVLVLRGKAPTTPRTLERREDDGQRAAALLVGLHGEPRDHRVLRLHERRTRAGGPQALLHDRRVDRRSAARQRDACVRGRLAARRPQRADHTADAQHAAARELQAVGAERPRRPREAGHGRLLPGRQVLRRRPGIREDRLSPGQVTMSTRAVALGLAALTALLLPGAAPAAEPADRVCSNEMILGGTFRNVAVAPGRWCLFGNAVVTGDFTAERASSVGIFFATHIMGNVVITNTSSHPDATGETFGGSANGICTSTIDGNLTVSDSGPAAPWNIGSTNYPPYANFSNCVGPNVIKGDVRFTANASKVNAIGANTIGGDLDCTANGGFTPGFLAPGTPNKVQGRSRGQCASLGSNPETAASPPATARRLHKQAALHDPSRPPAGQGDRPGAEHPGAAPRRDPQGPPAAGDHRPARTRSTTGCRCDHGPRPQGPPARLPAEPTRRAADMSAGQVREIPPLDVVGDAESLVTGERRPQPFASTSGPAATSAGHASSPTTPATIPHTAAARSSAGGGGDCASARARTVATPPMSIAPA